MATQLKKKKEVETNDMTTTPTEDGIHNQDEEGNKISDNEFQEGSTEEGEQTAEEPPTTT